MKHILPLTLCTVAVASLSLTAVNAHHGYIRQLTVQNAQAAAMKARAAFNEHMAAKRQADGLQAKLTKLQAECQKGVTAYNNLTDLAKKRTAKPDCSLQ